MVRGMMSDAEWAFFEPFVVEKGPRRGRRPRDHRLVLDIRARQHAAGAQDRGLGRSRGGFSTKIHLRSNALGLPVAVTLSGGQVSDMKGYGRVMDEPGPAPGVLLADKGYDADFILADLAAGGVAAVIPAKRNRKVQPVIDGHIYSLRNLVERCLSKAETQPTTGHTI